jgi:hypothetical protein
MGWGESRATEGEHRGMGYCTPSQRPPHCTCASGRAQREWLGAGGQQSGAGVRCVPVASVLEWFCAIADAAGVGTRMPLPQVRRPAWGEVRSRTRGPPEGSGARLEAPCHHRPLAPRPRQSRAPRERAAGVVCSVEREVVFVRLCVHGGLRRPDSHSLQIDVASSHTTRRAAAELPGVGEVTHRREQHCAPPCLGGGRHTGRELPGQDVHSFSQLKPHAHEVSGRSPALRPVRMPNGPLCSAGS